MGWVMATYLDQTAEQRKDTGDGAVSRIHQAVHSGRQSPYPTLPDDHGHHPAGPAAHPDLHRSGRRYYDSHGYTRLRW